MPSKKYLDNNGLSYFWGKIKSYISNALATKADTSDIPSPDWNENDSTSPDYIQNRTHYRESRGYTITIDNVWISIEVYENPITIAGTTYSYCVGGFSYSGDENIFPTTSFSDLDLTVNQITVRINNTEYTFSCLYTNYDETFGSAMFYIYNNEYVFAINPFLPNNYELGGSIYAVNSNIDNSLNIEFDIALSNEIFIYPKLLDKNYLDGYLITKADGTNSEIFNGVQYLNGVPSKKAASEYGDPADFAHMEGHSEVAQLSFYLTGEAGATSYDVTNYNGNLIYTYYMSGSELYQLNENTIEYEPTGVIVDYIEINDSTAGSGTIEVNNTLNATEAINGKSYCVHVPSMIAAYSAHTEGINTVASGSPSHAEGQDTVAGAYCSHAEGYMTTASGSYSHTEGYKTTASGSHSHAEGDRTTASGLSSHAEGNDAIASNSNSHAEGYNTAASGLSSHAEGSQTTASNDCSHAEGNHTTASGRYSHAEGYYTTASHRSQHVFGEYNVLDPSTNAATAKGTYVEIVGKGTSSSARSNARTLDWSGNEVLAGKLTIGSAPTADMDVATKKYVDDSVPTVPSWALASTKPTYTASEVGAVPSNFNNSNYIRVAEGAIDIHIEDSKGDNGDLIMGTYPSQQNDGASYFRPSFDRLELSNVVTPTSNTMAANKKYVDDSIAAVTDTNTTYTISISNNVITLTPSSGQAQSITLPVYNGSVSSS